MQSLVPGAVSCVKRMRSRAERKVVHLTAKGKPEQRFSENTRADRYYKEAYRWRGRGLWLLKADYYRVPSIRKFPKSFILYN